MRRRKTDAEAPDRIRRAFLGMALCHELKQPLHSLNLNVELLSKRLGAGAQVPEIGGPLQAFGRVVDRINDCLELFAERTLPPPIGPERLDVAALLDQAAERARATRPGARITVLAAPLPPIPGNAEQLEFAFEALLDNAGRASPAGAEIVVNARAGEEEVHIDVVDHGTGMAAEVARHAFDIGYSTWGGDGIGLTLAKFITYHHSGGFSMSSREGHGTTVSIVLPTTSEGAGDAVGD